MNGAAIIWLAAAAVVFIAASSALRSFAGSDWKPMLLVALALYTVGNAMMVPVMRAGGMAVAISLSSVLQLVLVTIVAFALFGERPGPAQMAGIALGIVSIGLILWAPGARQG